MTKSEQFISSLQTLLKEYNYRLVTCGCCGGVGVMDLSDGSECGEEVATFVSMEGTDECDNKYERYVPGVTADPASKPKPD